MRVLVLAPYIFDTSPGQRFRIEQWMPHLEAKGVRVDFDAFTSHSLRNVLYQRGKTVAKALNISRDYLRRFLRALQANRYDLVFIHREAAIIGPAWIERLLSYRGIPVVFDFDDSVHIPYTSPTSGSWTFLKFPAKTAAICRAAAHVIAGNTVLRDYAIQHTPHVSIVPTTIELAKYTSRCSYDFPVEPVIGWSGSHSSVQYLRVIRPALQRLAREFKFRLLVIGARSLDMDGVRVECRDWCSETEVADLSRIQIGLMPLPDDAWTRGKCALKALQYMALGTPTVVSPVGANCDVIRDGVNGLHANSENEWVATLSRLLRDRDLRQRLGEAGRCTVATEYSASVHAPRVLGIFEHVVRGSRSGARSNLARTPMAAQ